MVILSCLLLSIMAVGCSEDAGKDKAKEKDNKASTEPLKDNGGDSTKEEQTELETAPEPVVEEAEEIEDYSLGMNIQEFYSAYDKALIDYGFESVLIEDYETIISDTGVSFFSSLNTSLVINMNENQNIEMLQLLCSAKDNDEYDDCSIMMGIIMAVFMPDMDGDERHDTVFNALKYDSVKANEGIAFSKTTHNDYLMRFSFYNGGDDTLVFALTNKDNPKYVQ